MPDFMSQGEPSTNERALRVQFDDQFAVCELEQASLKRQPLLDYPANAQLARQIVQRFISNTLRGHENLESSTLVLLTDQEGDPFQIRVTWRLHFRSRLISLSLPRK